MKLFTNKCKSGGLHEKHVVATWSVGNRLSICFDQVVRNGCSTLDNSHFLVRGVGRLGVYRIFCPPENHTREIPKTKGRLNRMLRSGTVSVASKESPWDDNCFTYTLAM